ncbi:MAG: hypothetical protein HOW73_24495 [Polyangiaceae bacterium]|nr:hypothetical protein [Polyangiaceae bacterium]
MRLWSRFFQVASAAVFLVASNAWADDDAAQVPAPAPEQPALAAPAAPEKAAASTSTDWCSSELETLPHDVCYAPGPVSKAGKRTLVIFLHGLTQVDSGWQHSLQRGMKLAGKRLGFSLLTPKGRTKVGPGKKEDTIAWPINPSVRAVEDEVIAEWIEAKELVEKRDGAKFDEVFVMGFSNGAYYASSLALRGRLEVDGYGVFAGGSAPKGTTSSSKGVKNRKPVFVAIASKDETAKKGRELAKALKELKWPNRVVSAPVGHVVADGQLEQSLEYLRAPDKKASAKAPSEQSGSKKKTAKKSGKTAKSTKKKTNKKR